MKMRGTNTRFFPTLSPRLFHGMSGKFNSPAFSGMTEQDLRDVLGKVVAKLNDPKTKGVLRDKEGHVLAQGNERYFAREMVFFLMVKGIKKVYADRLKIVFEIGGGKTESYVVDTDPAKSSDHDTDVVFKDDAFDSVAEREAHLSH